MEAADRTEAAVVDSTAEAAGSTRMVAVFMAAAPVAGTLVEVAHIEVEACMAPGPTAGLHTEARHSAAVAGSDRVARDPVRLRPRACASVQVRAAGVSAGQADHRLGLTMRSRTASGIPLEAGAIQRLPGFHRDFEIPR